jgi:hypothetical protein
MIQSWIVFDNVLVDFAKAGGDWPHRRFDAGRQLILNLLDALIDELAREVDVGAILEHDRDLAQPIARKGPRVGKLWQTCHRSLDRERDALLDLKWRVARCIGVNLNLHVGDVGYGIDRQAREVVGTEGREAEHHKNNEPPLPD